MTDTYVAVNGRIASKVVLSAAETGPWWAECELESGEALKGAVVLQVGSHKLHGTIDPDFSGTFAEQFRCRIVGGANGWGKVLGSKIYHNDARARPRTIADDAARECGETIVEFPDGASKPIDYVRKVASASKTLEAAAGTLSWWVDFDGKTHVGPRPATKTDSKAYDVHHFNALTGGVQLGIDELDVWIGSTLSEGLDVPSIVRDIEVTITGGKMRCRAIVSEKPGARSVLDSLIRAIVKRLVDARLHGLYRYRVLSMGPDGRVSLQAVRKSAGLPDLLPVQQWPGVAGAHATLTKGSIVGVQFLEGDETLPVVTSYQGKQGQSFVPDVVTFGATDPADAIEVAYKGATVKVLTPPAAFSGTINGAPAAGVVVWPAPFTLGTIEVGTPRVKVGVR